MNKRVMKLIAALLILLLHTQSLVSLANRAGGTEKPSKASEKKNKETRPNKNSSSKGEKYKKPVQPVKKSKEDEVKGVKTPELLEGQSATLLPDGRWLLIGGYDKHGRVLARAEIRDLRTGATEVLANMLNQARAGHTATMLPTGEVFIFGGQGRRGHLLGGAELFNPEKNAFELMPQTELTPRAFHTATLLTDGRVLIAGGVAKKEQLLGQVEIWNPKSNVVHTLRAELPSLRQKHKAILQPNGSVLLWGGLDQNGSEINGGEIFDPTNETFTWRGTFPSQPDTETPRFEFSSPANSEENVPLDARAVLRFSKALKVETVNRNTLTLTGPNSLEETKIVPAEEGRLVFITPEKHLQPDALYMLTLTGSTDASNQSLSPVVLSFRTEKVCEVEPPVKTPPQPPIVPIIDEDSWVPTADNFNGDWSSKRPDSEFRKLPPLTAKEGVTALSGQVLSLSGNPLSGVVLELSERTAVADGVGRFLLTDIEPGTHVLTIYGNTVSKPGKTYGTFDVRVDVVQGKTSVLPYTVWLPVLDQQNAVKLDQPTKSEVVVRTSRVPGVEMRMAKDAVLRMPEGSHRSMHHHKRELKEVAITPIPLDRTPFPLPQGADKGLALTLQLHGAKVEGLNGEKRQGLRFTFPNVLKLPAGWRVNLWDYDSSQTGWYIYGYGTISQDGKLVVPDPGAELPSMHCLVFMDSGSPTEGPNAGGGTSDGDPVDLGTGLFVYEQTDLMLPDTMPISITRTYRQNDGQIRSFGFGTTLPYDIYLVGDTHNYGDIILPDGGKIHFTKDATGTFVHTETPTAFYGATLVYLTPSQTEDYSMGMWEVKLRDGTKYQFFRHTIYGDILGIHGSWTGLHAIIDRYGNRLRVLREVTNAGSYPRITKIVTPNGRWVEFSYDGTTRRITQIRDNIGRSVNYTYDASGRLWKVTDPGGYVTEYTYDTNHRMTSIKDPRGIVGLTNQYDAAGRVIRQTQADNSVYQFAYTVNAQGKVTQTDVTNPRGVVRRVTFNDKNFPLTDTYALGQAEQQTYTFTREANTNRVLNVTDSLGRKSAYTYNTEGKVISATWLADTTAAVTNSYTYEPTFGFIKTVTDPLNRTATFDYNEKGSLIKVTDAISRQTTFTHNAAGQVTSVTDPLNRTVTYIYDKGDLVQVRDPLGRGVKRFLDAAGRTVRMTDPLGGTGRVKYDGLNRPIQITDPTGAKTTIT